MTKSGSKVEHEDRGQKVFSHIGTTEGVMGKGGRQAQWRGLKANS